MKKTIKALLLCLGSIVIGYGGYIFGVTQTKHTMTTKINEIDNNANQTTPLDNKPKQVEKSITMDKQAEDLANVNIEELVAKLEDLKEFSDQMKNKQLQLNNQLEQFNNNLKISPDLENLNTSQLKPINPPEQILSNGVDDQSFTNSAGLSNNNASQKKHYKVNPKIKEDLQRDTGIAPEDVNAAFNIENTE